MSVRHFSAAEADRDLDPVSVSKELERALELCVQIVLADAGGHADLLDLHDALVLLGFLFALGLLKAVLAVVHDLADGGLCHRRYLDQVKLLLLRNFHGGLRGHYSKLLAVVADNAYFLVEDLFIDLMIHACDCKTPP